MEIATSTTREKYPLSFKKVWKKTLLSMIAWFGFIVIISFGFLIQLVAAIGKNALASQLNVVIIVLLLLFLIVFFLNYFYQRWYYAVYFYDLHEDYIVIKKGPITPREITIPYERIQDVYVDQDLLDRLFGLYDVHLSSATASSGMAAHIDGLEKQAAEGLREELLGIIKTRISRKN